ncbi:hypothetical protein AOC36_08355 [Erysipelothrix larvae]|uniref:DUF5655 domain-containing protein n=1 Tax=Erysipelothrix larvae TaxID=1514105 RepID=A0A0X8H0V6_9FIRM|nr:DUF5655 domain-containing protein [Erysipelothrix larvae]AMC93997.1 hypothetical protein AOC36_08355 [Erysipelothrix larvae]
MSNISVFNTSDENNIRQLESTSYSLESHLQKLIERNMKSFFSVDFLASEYSFPSGRIDSLGIDENNCPVIFEYKRSMNENVINQGLFYLEWLLDHKADFKLLVLDKYGDNRANAIEWKTPIVYCIANNFNKYDVNAVKIMQRNIYLVEYNLFENDLIIFDFLNLDSKVKEVGNDLIIDKSKKMQRDINDRMNTLNSNLKPILEDLRSFISEIGDDVSEVVLRQYIAYKKIGNFVTIDMTNDKIQMYLKVDPSEIELKNNMRDMTKIGHFGTGNLEIIITSIDDYYNSKYYIELAYNQN